MSGSSSSRKRRRSSVIPLATPNIEQAMGEALIDQPLIEDAKETAAVRAGRSGVPQGGKARAKKLGKAKLSAIAKKVTRSRWKKTR